MLKPLTLKRAQSMARTLVGAAVMQGAAGMLTATAPIVARVPGESAEALIFAGVFALLWLTSAACFRTAWHQLRKAQRPDRL